MLFNSFPYLLLFLPAAAIVCSLTLRYAGPRASQAWLLISSVLFYCYSSVSFVPLLLGSVVFNWAIARWMDSCQQQDARKRIAVWVGVAANVVFLGAFKYLRFFARSLAALHGPTLALPDWPLPLGISFFTLTQVMYLVDTYQGLNKANSLFDHATLVCFFPYVTSGPLVRSREVVAQFKSPTFGRIRLELAARGVYLFSLGLAKKAVLAHSFGKLADAGFSAKADLSMIEAWLASFAYTFQIYFDFSGYSDMAVGSAWLLGINIPQNFNAPYLSKSISEFWQRWHISLSNFITHYLYTPIVRSMGTVTIRSAVTATIVSMGIAGLWHGPAGTFIVFGLLHGLALAANQVWKKRKRRMPDWLGWLTTFVFVNSAFVIFRSPNLSFAIKFLSQLLPHHRLLGTGALTSAISLATMAPRVLIGVAAAFAFKTSADLSRDFRPLQRNAFATAFLLLVSYCVIDATVQERFVYFGF